MSWCLSRFIHQCCLKSHKALVLEEIGGVVSVLWCMIFNYHFYKFLKFSPVGGRSKKSLPLGFVFFPKTDHFLKDEDNL